MASVVDPALCDQDHKCGHTGFWVGWERAGGKEGEGPRTGPSSRHKPGLLTLVLDGGGVEDGVAACDAEPYIGVCMAISYNFYRLERIGFRKMESIISKNKIWKRTLSFGVAQ